MRSEGGNRLKYGDKELETVVFLLFFHNDARFFMFDGEGYYAVMVK